MKRESLLNVFHCLIYILFGQILQSNMFWVEADLPGNGEEIDESTKPADAVDKMNERGNRGEKGKKRGQTLKTWERSSNKKHVPLVCLTLWQSEK